MIKISDIAYQLQALVEDIDDRLSDENRDRQMIAEDASATLHAIIDKIHGSEPGLKCGACLAPLPGAHKRDCPVAVAHALKIRS